VQRIEQVVRPIILHLYCLPACRRLGLEGLPSSRVMNEEGGYS